MHSDHWSPIRLRNSISSSISSSSKAPSANPPTRSGRVKGRGSLVLGLYLLSHLAGRGGLDPALVASPALAVGMGVRRLAPAFQTALRAGLEIVLLPLQRGRGCWLLRGECFTRLKLL